MLIGAKGYWFLFLGFAMNRYEYDRSTFQYRILTQLSSFWMTPSFTSCMPVLSI